MSEKTVMQVLPDFGLAGAERMAEHLCIELAARGWNVVAVSLFTCHTDITQELESSGIPVEFLDKRPGLDLTIVPKLRKLFKAKNPAVVHSHRYCMQYILPASLGLQFRGVHTIHNIAEKEVPSRIQKMQGRAFQSGKTVPVAINTTVKESVCNLYSLDEASVPLVYNGVPNYTPSRVELPGDPDAFAFLTIGRAMAQKNQLALVRAFNRFHQSYPKSKLLIVGDGELREAIESEIASLGASQWIYQMGGLPNARDYCYAADAFVLPSLYEGMPMTLIEAMSAGMPVIASRRGGSVDMVQDGATGYLCEPDEASIESALMRLYLDPHRKKVADAGRRSSLDFTSYAMADGYERVYEK